MVETLMEENKKGYYAIIPANVRYNENLTPNAKLLYGEITALCNDKGFCWAGNDYFAALYKVSKSTVSVWISSLIKEGFISREIIYKEESKEIYQRWLSITPPPKNLNSSPENSNDPPPKNLRDNNTGLLLHNNILLSKDNKSLRPHLNKKACELLLKYMSADRNNATKTQIYIEENLTALVKHTFFEKNFFETKYLEQHKDSVTLLNSISGWESLEKALKVATKRLEEARLPGNFPADKKTLPKDLYNFLYNPRSYKSWFLYFLTNKTKKQNAENIEQIWVKLTEKQQTAAKAFLKKYHPEWDEGVFASKAVKTAKWLHDNFEDYIAPVPGSYNMFDGLATLLERFWEFESGFLNGDSKFTVNNFGPESDFWWKWFMPWIKKNIGVTIPRKIA